MIKDSNIESVDSGKTHVNTFVYPARLKEKKVKKSIRFEYGTSFFSKTKMLHPEIPYRQCGKVGDFRPYFLRNDDFISGALMLSFICIFWVISRGYRFFMQQISDFFVVRERPSIFSIETTNEFRYQLFFIFLSCFLVSLLGFNVLQEYGYLHLTYASSIFVGFLLGVTCVYEFLKIILYAFVNWIFFDKKKNSSWMEAYTFILSLEGIVLFPLILLVVYFNVSLSFIFPFTVIVLVISRILLLYKTYNIFFEKFYGLLHLIVYFCALEVVPFLLWIGALLELTKTDL